MVISVTKAMRVVITLLTLASLLLFAQPAQANTALPPGHAPIKYQRWSYPSQMTYGPLEDGRGTLHEAASAAAFMTLPFMGPHYITSIFDHCGPNYNVSGRICRYDGVIASAKVGGPDPGFGAGYAQTPGLQDYLYYSGHDGYDYGLYYEPVAAAAPGRVILSNWLVPGCHTCLSGLTVEIDHGNGLMTFYGHMSKIWVSKGESVARGQVLGISGMTGTATGPHLHFGVYHTNGAGPVDPYGWSGSGSDPYVRDLGNLWLGGSPRFANVAMPSVNLTATLDQSDPSSIHVRWSGAASAKFTVYWISDSGVRHSWHSSQGGSSATFAGTAGHTYWFWASATSPLGWTGGGGSDLIEVASLNDGVFTN